MSSVISLYNRLASFLASRWFEGLALLFTRIALAGIFWRSGRSKVEEGTWLQVSEATGFLFEYEYTGVPLLSPQVAAPMATYAEHLFPILLALGLATRFSAAALLGMTLVIQLFVYRDAWWSVHILWTAMALVLISRSAGVFSLDAAIAARTRA
ncbi:DoxX family protein [Altererythrobacter sp. GH1-8]|uniref:DoxX family protein n=1 Tax=Altererythrobacter sp. GH1-8 TaxID=3349333 RepID=UPI00374DB93A